MESHLENQKINNIKYSQNTFEKKSKHGKKNSDK
jgi:hypothetical protein